MSANPLRGEVKILLDRERTLKIDFNAMIEAEELLGQPFDLTKMFDLGAKGLRALLFVGLKKEDPELTLEKTGEIAFLCDQARVMEAVLNSVWGGKVPDEVKERASKNVHTPVAPGKLGESLTVSEPQFAPV